ncbi:CopG family transcriptional regulator [Caenimonas soli]|uniref:CopG family transcriptional regulator n=1 Tax=Caenimonas soli TaxID=2735555 RepID=UPI0015520404|nr:CopG family transcriptional regulator [Caenimonas soli]NPC58420.1 CopG family transcriptional regulator [Caenimonas soli]
MQRKTARISVLIDAGKKAALAATCEIQETTPSQVVRSLITEFLVAHGANLPGYPKRKLDKRGSAKPA